jgi:hypothetical protein
MPVRIAKVDALAAAFPSNLAFNNHSVLFEASFPGLQFFN